jgi:hypothetical protein
MRPPIASFPFLAAAFVLVPGVAHAHITLNDPQARNPADDLKAGPCGLATGDARTTDPEKITTYTAGETIEIQFTETVQHNSHYRVQLSSTGNAGFVDPTGYDDRELGPNDLYQSEDDPAPGGFTPEEHTIEVTLPNEPCEECTLQLIQVMTDKAPFTAGGDDIYYQCADIVILPGEGGGTGGAGSGGGDGAGGGDGVGGSGGTAAGGALGSGGALISTGGSTGSGGFPSAGGTAGIGTGGQLSSGGAPSGAGGGGDVPPPPAMGGCSLPAAPVGFGSAGWLALGGLSWFALRRRRSA